MICPGDPHQRNTNAPKIEDRCQEETERQERCAREAAWRLAKNIPKLKEKNEATFFSSLENWCLPAPSTLEPEEREFVVDSGASMHMISNKGLEWCWNWYLDEVVLSYNSHNSRWRSADDMKRPQFMSKNWIHSWQWKSSRIRQQFSSLGKLCDEHGYSFEWSTVKNHISSKTVFGYFATRRTSFLSWFLVCQRGLPPLFPLQHLWHLQHRRLIILHFLQARLLHQWHLQLFQATVRLEQGKTWVG